MNKTTVIYEPTGKAKEYNPLALNLYRGCNHGCIYCYAPTALRISREEFGEVKSRKDIIEKIQIDARILSKEKPLPPILMCFTCDPYQLGRTYKAKQAIEVLKFYGLNVKILTKGGMRAAPDIKLLSDGDYFGVTLTCDNDKDSLEWEPGAALPMERIETLKIANAIGVKTWVSLEPVLYPEQTLDLIDMTHKFVDEFKVGKLNYHPNAADIDWRKFGMQVIAKLESLGKKYYIKDDLKKFLN
jgi:DNA repair photolyase